MKVVAKSIEMVAWFDKEGIPHPVRFRITNKDESCSVIKIDTVVTREKERLAGNEMFIFNCKSLINGTERMLQIKYELCSCKWILFKI